MLSCGAGHAAGVRAGSIRSGQAARPRRAVPRAPLRATPPPLLLSASWTSPRLRADALREQFAGPAQQRLHAPGAQAECSGQRGFREAVPVAQIERLPRPLGQALEAQRQRLLVTVAAVVAGVLLPHRVE